VTFDLARPQPSFNCSAHIASCLPLAAVFSLSASPLPSTFLPSGSSLFPYQAKTRLLLHQPACTLARQISQSHQPTHRLIRLSPAAALQGLRRSQPPLVELRLGSPCRVGNTEYCFADHFSLPLAQDESPLRPTPRSSLTIQFTSWTIAVIITTPGGLSPAALDSLVLSHFLFSSLLCVVYLFCHSSSMYINLLYWPSQGHAIHIHRKITACFPRFVCVPPPQTAPSALYGPSPSPLRLRFPFGIANSSRRFSDRPSNSPRGVTSNATVWYRNLNKEVSCVCQYTLAV